MKLQLRINRNSIDEMQTSVYTQLTRKIIRPKDSPSNANAVFFGSDPILKQVAEPIATIDESAVAVIQDLVDTMVDSGHSVGVAAPQIGVLQRAVVVDVSKSKLGKDNNHALFVFNGRFRPLEIIAHRYLAHNIGDSIIDL